MSRRGPWHALWFYGIALVSLLLLLTTLAGIEDFDLRHKSNYATLWSGLVLLLIGLHAYDGALLNRDRKPSIARAWSVVALLLTLLSFDEIGAVALRTELEGWQAGAKLAGMIVLLAVALPNTRGLLATAGQASHPVLEVVRSLRTPILWLGLVAAPLVAIGTHGLPAEWPSAALFLLAAMAALRPFLTSSGQADWRGWLLALFAFVGCTGTTMSLDARPVWLATELISLGAIAIWIVDSRFRPRKYLPATLLLVACLAAARLFPGAEALLYTMMAYVALAHYSVNSTAS